MATKSKLPTVAPAMTPGRPLSAWPHGKPSVRCGGGTVGVAVSASWGKVGSRSRVVSVVRVSVRVLRRGKAGLTLALGMATALTGVVVFLGVAITGVTEVGVGDTTGVAVVDVRGTAVVTAAAVVVTAAVEGVGLAGAVATADVAWRRSGAPAD